MLLTILGHHFGIQVHLGFMFFSVKEQRLDFTLKLSLEKLLEKKVSPWLWSCVAAAEQ